MPGSVATLSAPPGGPFVIQTPTPAAASAAIPKARRASPETSFIGVCALYGRRDRAVASALLLDLLAHGLHLGVLEAEQLRDPPRELVLDGGELAVGIHDAPDHLDEAQPLARV